jgi:hypothetical protein
MAPEFRWGSRRPGAGSPSIQCGSMAHSRPTRPEIKISRKFAEEIGRSVMIDCEPSRKLKNHRTGASISEICFQYSGRKSTKSVLTFCLPFKSCHLCAEITRFCLFVLSQPRWHFHKVSWP